VLAAWAGRDRRANKERFFTYFSFLKKKVWKKSLTIEAHPPQFQDPDLFLKNVSQ
jgi:hypothetical protein